VVVERLVRARPLAVLDEAVAVEIRRPFEPGSAARACGSIRFTNRLSAVQRSYSSSTISHSIVASCVP
jgi:hypothetical protein